MDYTVQKNISFKTANEYYLLAGKIHAYLNRLHTYQMVVWYAFSSSLISKHPIPIFVKKGFDYKRAFLSNKNLYDSTAKDWTQKYAKKTIKSTINS